MSDKRSSKINLVNPYASADAGPRIPTDLVEHQDLYRSSTTADRAYDKFLSRGLTHGHDVEDWLSSEREIEVEAQGTEARRRANGSQKQDPRTI